MDISAIESKFRSTPDMKSSSAEEGMVATAFPHATRAGVEILRRGGNAVDAACASAFAIGVCEPQASGIGGESNAILNMDGMTIALDGSSRAPGLVDINTVDEESLSTGYKGTTVPSTVAVLGHLHRRFGRLKWNEILEPAINIAREGFEITQFQHDLQIQELSLFKKVPSLSGAGYYLKDGLKPFETGELFTQPDLVLILQDIADFGPEYFYTGKPASIIDEDMRANGGFLRSDDLGRIPWPVERTPITTKYRGLKIATLPPSSGGRMLLHTLGALDRCPPSFIAGQTPESYSLLAGIFKSALHLNEENIPHPDYYSPENDFMLSGEPSDINIKSMMENFFPDASGETTHLSVMDSQGNSVGITQSINHLYGCKAAAEGLGFLYNSYLSDMNRDDPEHPHYFRPNGLSYSSVAPAVIFYKDSPWMVLGSPGSQRIFTALSQFLINVVDRNMTISEAMEEPRMHYSINNLISIEADRFHPSVLSRLKEEGYEIDRRGSLSFYFGSIQTVLKKKSGGGGFQGIADVRRDGTAGGI